MKHICFLIIASLLLYSCNDQGNESEKMNAEVIHFTKEGNLNIHKQDSTTVNLEIETAETDYETATGLMYRDAMEKNRGMLFIFNDERVHSFYMKNTEFPLDIIYINADHKIASIAKNAKPFSEESLSSQVPIQYVLEVNGGMTETWNVKAGDSISWKLD